MVGVASTFLIIKRLTGSGYNPPVAVNSGDLNFSKRANLDLNGAFAADASFFQDTNPSSSVITLGNNGNVNASSVPHICYAFAPSQFIAIGSYKGNGNTNGSFVPTINSLGVPIQPAWFLTKNTTEAESWNLQDTARHPNNEVDISLFPNSTATDTAGYDKDFVTGGFKMRTTKAGVNKSGITYVYMAFGTPFIDRDGRIIGGR